MKKILLFLFLFFIFGCSNMFFYPEKRHFINTNLLNYTYENIYFFSTDNIKLHSWLFKSEKNKGTIVFLHGNAENISTHIDSMFWLIDEGFNVFAIDYRGYGKSDGKPTIKGTIEDAISAITYIQTIDGLNKNLIIYGQSIGATIAITALAKLKNRDNIKALVIESPFSSYRKIAKDKIQANLILKLFYPFIWFIDDNYSPQYFIEEIYPIPILMMHGKEDPIVPYYHSLKLYELAKEPKTLILKEKSRHINLWHFEDVRNEILKFLEKSLKN